MSRASAILFFAALHTVCASWAPGASAQTLYKSVGPDGKVSYTDRPPANGRIAKTLKVEDLPNTALPAKTAEELKRLQAAAPSSRPPTLPAAQGVFLFSAKWCGYCRQAKTYLAAKGIAYQDLDIDTPDGMAAFARNGGGGGVPLLLVNGQRVRGFRAEGYDQVFAGVKK